MEGGGWRVEGGGWRMEDGGWRMEDGGWRDGDERREGVLLGLGGMRAGGEGGGGGSVVDMRDLISRD
jgi:hypothetical protein